MAKKVLFHTDARTKLLAGALQLAEAVRLTMGPKGRNVVFEKAYGVPVNTNDGVTIAREIDPEDPFESMGAQLVREAAIKTNDAAGDGTTTATVLAVEFIRNGLSLVNEGANPVSIKNGIHKAVDHVVAHLKTISRQVKTSEDIRNVASLSSASKEVGEVIANIMEKIGNDGVITVEEGQRNGLETEIVSGMQVESGFISNYMMTDTTRMECVLEKPVIIVTDKQISDFGEIINVVEEAAKSGKKNCVIFASDMSGNALATLIMNKVRGTFNTLVVRAPGFGDRKRDTLQDIATVTGAEFISEDAGNRLKSATVSMCGTAAKVIATKDKTVIIDGAGSKDDVQILIDHLKEKAKLLEAGYELEKLRERIAKVAGGIAVIRVGASTEVEMVEKRHRLEDAVSATRAAVEEGIVAGGGMTLFNCVGVLDKLKGADESEAIGIKIVARTLSAPIKQIIENAGQEFSSIAGRLQKVDPRGTKHMGYDADTGKIVNMFDKGIIDPTKVVRCALENAASVAAMFLTTGAAVITKREEQNKFERSL